MLALRARQRCDVQELRHRRQSRACLLRREALSAYPRHDDRLDRSRDRAADRARTDRTRGVGANSSYGYSETSAPICVNHIVVIGAAGSDYRGSGVRDGLPHRSHPGLGEPVLDDPAHRDRVAQQGLPVGGATNWTPEAVDTTTYMLYFGTAAAAPEYYPSLRPGLGSARGLSHRCRPLDRASSNGGSSSSPSTSGPTTSLSRRWSRRPRSAGSASGSSRWRRWKGSGLRYSAVTGAPIYHGSRCSTTSSTRTSCPESRLRSTRRRSEASTISPAS